MKLVSWNLNGLEDEHLDRRTEAAMFQILLGAPIEAAIAPDFKPNTPDIILLQEVVERTYYAHLVPHLKAAGFAVFPDAPTERSYFEIVAVRQDKLEASYETFPYTQQGRGLTTLKLNDITILTSHFESMDLGKHKRVDQAQLVIDHMSKIGPCVFAGDTNLRQEEWEGLNHANIIDAWQSIGSPKAHQTTWQQQKARCRFDRVWAHNVTIKSFTTFGKANVPNLDVSPSDHYGLRFELER